MMGERQNNRYGFVFVLALSLLFLVPSLFKPPHIDEESYLFISQSIIDWPQLPYNWWRLWQPFTEPASNSFIYAHPPLFVWSLAFVQRVFALGTVDVVFLRLSQWGWWVLLAWGVYQLAGRLCRNRMAASFSILLSPSLLLVGHQSLMIDLPTIALMTATMALAWPHFRGDAGSNYGLVAGCLFGLASITKYPSLLLFIPIFVLARPWEKGIGRLFTLMVPWAFFFIGFQLYTAIIYGTPHLYYVLLHAGEIARTTVLSKGIGTLSHLGGTLIMAPLLLFVLLGWRRVFFASLVGATGLFLCLMAIQGSETIWMETLAEGLPASAVNRALLIMLFTLGIGLLFVMLAPLKKGLNRGDDAILATWALIMVGGVVLFHNFVGTRYLALATVPIGLLLWRRLEGTWVVVQRPRLGAILALSVSFSVVLTGADIRWARSWHEPFMGAKAEIPSNGAPVYVAGEWTFRYLGESVEGLPYLGLDQPKAGAWILTAPEASPPKIPDGAKRIAQFKGEGAYFRVHAPEAKIGLYSDAFGYLPFGFYEGPQSIVELWQVQ